MLSRKNNNIIFVKKGHKPSRFLVDLNRLNSEKESEDKKNKFGFNFFQKSSKPDKFFTDTSVLTAKKDSGQKAVSSGFNNWRDKHYKKFERLVFFSIIKFIFAIIFRFFKIAYKISYAVGWLTVFLIRFIYLFFNKTLKLVFRPLTLLKFRFKIKTDRPLLKLKPDNAYQTQIKKIGNYGQAEEFNDKKIDSEYSAVKMEEISGVKNKKYSFFKILKSAWLFLFLVKASIKLFGFFKKPVIAAPEKEHIEPKKFSLKSAFIFSVILLALTLPLKTYLEYKKIINLKGDILGISQAAVGNMIAASKSAGDMNFSQASDDLTNASANFVKAKAEIKDINFLLGILGKIIPGRDAKMAANAGYILDAGRLSSDIGNKILSSLEKIPKGGEGDVKIFFENLYVNIKSAASEAVELKKSVEKINPDGLPDEYRAQFTALREKSALITGSLNEISDILDKARIFLGFDYDKRYLLVFQNNAEMRASGGFIGSYAVVDFRNGKILKIEAPGGGSYDTEGGLFKRIIAPVPLSIVNPLWHFWDANWWPDWPTTAKKLAWFYEESGGTTVDGVISFTPSVVEKLLEVIGPIDLKEKYGVVFNKDNFWQETQAITEEKYKFLSDAPASSTPVDTKKNITNQAENEIILASSTIEKTADKMQPKNIIRDLFNKIIEELPKRLDKSVGLSLIGMLESSLKEKQTMFFFYDGNLENKIKDLGWDGSVKTTYGDYLMVVNSNIAGGKSDRKIEEFIDHKAEVAPDGTITDTLVIKRTHSGFKNEQFVGVRNVDWMRVYVPLGAELISAEGFNKPNEKYFEEPDSTWQKDKDLAAEENAVTHALSGTKIYNESGKTVFANWSMVDPGETITIYLKYRLPVKINNVKQENGLTENLINLFNSHRKEIMPYSLLVQKQPGSIGSEITSKLAMPDNFKVVWSYPENISADYRGWTINDILKTDKFWATLVEPQN
jgi:hypothetical protein